MNKSLRLTIITVLTIVISSCFISCDSEGIHADLPPVGPLGPLDFVSSDSDRRYIDSDEDSIIVSSSHELLFEALHNYSIDWERVLTILSVCNDYKFYDRWSLEYQQQWEAEEEINAFDGAPVEADWIKVEIIKGTPFKLRISIKKNETDKQRAACFMMCAFDGPIEIQGRFVIVQKPAVDSTPFKVKLRYKGKLYETEASLNENEELVFQNDEVTELMAMLRAKPGVETVLMDSEIVDFIDKEDLDKEPRLAALAARDGMQRVTCPSHPGNWNAGFRFMETGAVGYCALFDDKNFSDTYFVKNLTSRYSVFDVLDMHNIGLNDKVSSIAVAYEATDNDVCAVLTLWEDDHFNHNDTWRNKHRLSLIAAPYNAHAWWSDLKNVPCLGSSKSWNDRASSFSFHFGRLGTQLKDY
ncbi:MAG: hypothetical protein K2H75_09510 [Muribaculaceae bacterium]|nr:hypothetical protein [Muribaculaceae bacterium]